MINPSLLEALDQDLSNYLEEYLVALVRADANGYGPVESVQITIGRWLIEKLGYPLTLPNADHHQASGCANSKRFKTVDYRNIIFERDGNVCLKCKSPYDLTVDHIIPVSKGGATTLDNLQTLCRTCNSQKGDKTERY